MQIVPIQPLPNQTFSVALDNNQWGFAIRATNGTISFTLTLNGELIIQNTRVVGGMRIIPSKYEEAGNFVLVTQNFQIPDYTQFGTSQQLLYASPAELDIIRARPPLPLTPADFDPNAALPLRLFPQGYVLAP